MSIELVSTDFQKLIRIVQRQPSFVGETERRSLIRLGFGNASQAQVIMSQLDFSGTPMNAAVTIVSFLCQYGQVERGIEAVGVLIDQLLANMGLSEDADFLADIVTHYKLVNKLPSSPSPIPRPSLAVNADDKYVFISYARPDRAFAEQVDEYLMAVGFRTFRDTSNIVIGDMWDLRIEKALTEATHMVLLLSAASMPYRKEVYREWFFFDQQRKPLLPLKVQDCTLHSRIEAINYLDGQINLATALEQLVIALNQP